MFSFPSCPASNEAGFYISSRSQESHIKFVSPALARFHFGTEPNRKSHACDRIKAITTVATSLSQSRFYRADPCSYGAWCSHGKWIPYDWSMAVGAQLGKAIRAGDARIILNAPPRIGKSDLATKWTGLWFLDRWPDKSLVIGSYGAELAAQEFGRKMRDEAEQNPRIGVSLREDSKATHRWHTQQGGGLYAVGVGGSIVGRGFDLGLLDDPIKNWAEAQSWGRQQVLRDWFRAVWLTRAEPGASIVITMQRWADDDLCGWLLAGGLNEDDPHGTEWRVIRLPALCDGADDFAGRPVGAALCPQRFDEAAYAATRRSVGDAVWKACYQQAPEPLGAGAAYGHFGPWNETGHLEPDPSLPLCLAVDWNIHPGMHGVIGQYDGIADEFRVFELIHRDRLPVASPDGGEGLAELFLRRWGHWSGEIHIYGDPSGHASSIATGKSLCVSLVEALRRQIADHLIWLKIDKSPPAVSERVEATNQALKDTDAVSHLLIDRQDAAGLIHDLKRVKLNDRQQIDKSDPDLTHASEALGFWIERQRPLRLESSMPAGRFGVTV